jgi:hypothetical protein
MSPRHRDDDEQPATPVFNIVVNVNLFGIPVMAVSQDVTDFCSDLQGFGGDVAKRLADAATAVEAAQTAQKAAEDALAAAQDPAAVQAQIDAAVKTVTDQVTQDHADEIAALKAALATAQAAVPAP